MKLIVALGNPGEKYFNTKHNIGFKFLDYFLIENNLKINKNKYNGEFIKTIFNNKNVIFSKPLTYMNNSGNFVLEIVNYYKIKNKDILIISDDKDQNLGKYKFNFSVSSGGHNGIKSIINELKTKDFYNLKIGIGKINKIENTSNFVLSNFKDEEIFLIEKNFSIFKEKINNFINEKQ